MKKTLTQLAEHWDTAIGAVVIVAVMVLLLCVWVISPPEDTQEQAVMTTAIATLAVAIVSGLYAWHTRRLAKATVRMAEEMREQRYDAVRPVVDIQGVETDPDTLIGEGLAAGNNNTSYALSCTLRNVGFGPAFDVQSLVQYPWDAPGEKRLHDFGTIPVGGETDRNLNLPLSLELEDGRIALVVCYRDVHGRNLESSRDVLPDREEGWASWAIGPLQVITIS